MNETQKDEMEAERLSLIKSPINHGIDRQEQCFADSPIMNASPREIFTPA